MKIYKLTLLLITMMILTVTAVSAADANDVADIESADESDSLELDESVSEAETSSNDDVLADDGNTFSSLQADIEGGGLHNQIITNLTVIKIIKF